MLFSIVFDNVNSESSYSHSSCIPNMLSTINRRICTLHHRRKSKTTLATLDSGAMEHVTGSIKNLTKVTDHYSVNKPCHLSLWNASDQEMSVSARGDIADDIRGVLVSPDCESTLISATKFQADGLGVWLPLHS